MAHDLHITEVSPRDGLQNEAAVVGVEEKVRLIHALESAGLPEIEAGSFVSPSRVPQMADSDAVFEHLSVSVSHIALVPNEKGLDRALAAGVRKIAIFASASETFSRRNLGVSLIESLDRYAMAVRRASQAEVIVRGYVSCAVACPFEGEIEPRAVCDLVCRLLDMGVDEIDLADTIGVAVPMDIDELLDLLVGTVPPSNLVLHLHDTYGRALACAVAGIRHGVRKFDASVAGLGGCPFAPGAAGNLATEDLVSTVERMGFETGIDLDRLLDAAEFAAALVGRVPGSRTWQAMRGCKPEEAK